MMPIHCSLKRMLHYHRFQANVNHANKIRDIPNGKWSKYAEYDKTVTQSN